MTALGTQTVVVKERLRAKHGKYIDGPGKDWHGCSVQPVGSDEQHRLGTTGTSQWNLFAPPGFPTSTDNVILWNGLELQVDGRLQEWMDEETHTVEYVGGVLKLWEG